MMMMMMMINSFSEHNNFSEHKTRAHNNFSELQSLSKLDLFPVTIDGHSGAVHQRRCFFGSGSATAFFRHQRQAAATLFFLTEKAAALQRCFLSKFSAAVATPNKLLPRLF